MTHMAATADGRKCLQASHLEHLLYVGAISGNIGFAHGGNANETRDTGGNENPDDEVVCNAHGHGEVSGYSPLMIPSFPSGRGR